MGNYYFCNIGMEQERLRSKGCLRPFRRGLEAQRCPQRRTGNSRSVA